MLSKFRVMSFHIVVIEPLLEVGGETIGGETERDQAVPTTQGS